MNDLTDYPRTPGWQPPETSVEAAGRVAVSIGHLQARVLAAIRAAGAAGLTADEAAAALDLSPFTARPRVTELAKLGLIRDTGARRLNNSGRRAIAWQAVPDSELAQSQAEAEAQSRRLHTSNEAERQVRRIMKEEP